MGYRQEWCKNMKDRIEDKKDIKLQKEMKQYRKRIYEASGNELAAVLKEIQEYMEQEFNVESMVLLFTELSSLLNEKEESPDILQLIVFLAMQKCRFMQINLFGFGKEIYTMYHDSLCFLRYRLRFLMYPKQLIDIAEEDKTYLAHVYFSLMDFGVDGLLLFVHGLFSSGASFQCPYCGRVYELPSLLPGDESEGKIQPVFRKEHAGVYDPYFMFKHYLDEMQEEDLNSMLPYIYMAILPVSHVTSSFLLWKDCRSTANIIQNCYLLHQKKNLNLYIIMEYLQEKMENWNRRCITCRWHILYNCWWIKQI